MIEFITHFDWLGLVPIMGLWIVTVLVSVRVLEWLFPRIQHGEVEPNTAQSEVLPWYPIPPRVRQLLERRGKSVPWRCRQSTPPTGEPTCASSSCCSPYG